MKSRMLCAKCKSGSNLQDNKNGKLECDSCGGTFLEFKIIQKVVPGFKIKTSSLKSSEFACPNDYETMVIQKISGIELESCPKCKGIWFDKNEIKEMIKRERSEFNMPNEFLKDLDLNKANGIADDLMLILSIFSGR